MSRAVRCGKSSKSVLRRQCSACSGSQWQILSRVVLASRLERTTITGGGGRSWEAARWRCTRQSSAAGFLRARKVAGAKVCRLAGPRPPRPLPLPSPGLRVCAPTPAQPPPNCRPSTHPFAVHLCMTGYHPAPPPASLTGLGIHARDDGALRAVDEPARGHAAPHLGRLPPHELRAPRQRQDTPVPGPPGRPPLWRTRATAPPQAHSNRPSATAAVARSAGNATSGQRTCVKSARSSFVV